MLQHPPGGSVRKNETCLAAATITQTVLQRRQPTHRLPNTCAPENPSGGPNRRSREACGEGNHRSAGVGGQVGSLLAAQPQEDAGDHHGGPVVR